uniref:PucR family transcriptional regulator ligand-binding domain-containing protein n=1 Tax=uncultured Corynebacterium sp. TaxID=159447 RepID=UPI0025DA60DD
MPESFPLSWLQAQQHLDLHPVVTTDTTAEFSVIQPTELTDPREFLLPGAVVLTVGVALVREEAPFPAYVAHLAEAQVTAVGFGTGLFYPEVPDALVSACRDGGIALFEVPRHTAFISILNTVAEERARRDRRDREHLIAVQEQLSAAAVRGGMDALLTDTASHLSGAVAVTDNDARLLGRCDRTAGNGTLLSAVEVGREQVRSSADHHGSGAEAVWRMTQRMTPQGERVHFITVLADHPFSPHDRAVLKHAAGLADILLQRPSYLRRARTELNSLALRMRLGLGGVTGSGGAGGVGQILDQAADGDGRVRPTVVAADRVADLRKALTAADRATADSGRHLFATELDTSTMLFLFRGSRSVDAVASTFGPAAHRVRIAVGEPVAWDEVTMDRVRRLETAARSLAPGAVAGPY